MRKRLNKKDQYIVDDLFVNDSSMYEDNLQEQIEGLRSNGGRYRVKTIKSGDYLESEIYPLWETNSKVRKAKIKESRLAQRNLNNKNTVKKLIRLMNCNFTNNDIMCTFTYDDAHLPSDIKKAQRDVINYLRRLKTYVKHHNLPELKYIYVTEYNNTDEKKIRVHHHIVMNFPERDVAEKYWKGGARTQSRRLQHDEFGLEGLARYITKDPKGTKRYTCSQNLKKPIVTVADSKMTNAKVLKIIEHRIDAKAFFTKMYKGYKFNDIQYFFSDYVSGAYIRVRMKC